MADIMPLTFALDGMLGGLARWMRLLGVSAETSRQPEKPMHYFLSTSTKNFSKFPDSKPVLVPKAPPLQQLKFLLTQIPMLQHCQPFTICSCCNEKLIDIDKNNFREHIPLLSFNKQQEFKSCPKCHRIYWMGDHTKRMLQTLQYQGIMLPNPKI